jgi:hypothetical protein
MNGPAAAEVAEVLVKGIAPALGVSPDRLEAELAWPRASNCTPDESFKWRVKDARAGAMAFALVSPPEYPDSVRKGMEKLSGVLSAAPKLVSDVIVPPLTKGDVEGCSYAAFPLLHPLQSNKVLWLLQRARLRPRLMRWLREVALETRTRGNDPAVVARYRAALELCESEPCLSGGLRARSASALKRLELGRWSPVSVLMHGDFWRSNIMLREPNWLACDRFAVIDWNTAMVDGYPLFDLVRCQASLAIRTDVYRREILAHSKIVECDPVDTTGYILAGIGNVGLSLDNFPKPRWLNLAECAVSRHLQNMGGI